jgi:sphinganine-1-phosphate aldolase
MVWLLLGYFRDFLIALLVILMLSVLSRDGIHGLLGILVKSLLYLPGVKELVGWYLKKEVKGFMSQLGINKDNHISSRIMEIPETGLNDQELLNVLKEKKGSDFDSDTGKGFAYVYTTRNDQFKSVQKAFDYFQLNQSGNGSSKDNISNVFFRAFLHENALNPMVFPSLRQFEVEAVAMTAWMLHGQDGVVGNLTSGGTESILMAMKTYRDRARHLCPHITKPEVVASITVHPAFEKAAAYFDLKVVHVPINKNYRLDFGAYKKVVYKYLYIIMILCLTNDLYNARL